jgi:sugar porter (SP) family MFS transporter
MKPGSQDIDANILDSSHEIQIPRSPKFSFLRKLYKFEKLNRAEKSLMKVTFIVGLGGLTMGYNIGVICGGLEDISDRFDMSLNREGFFVAAMFIGLVIGSCFGGIMADIIGRWWTCQWQAILFVLGSLIISVSENYGTAVLGRFIIGIAAALASVASVPYLKEISPAKYRGRFQGAFEISVSGGILLSNCINIISYHGNMSWRLVFGFPLILAALESMLLFLLPESPSFLSQKGRLTEASKALEKIYNDPELVENEFYSLRLENMRKTDGPFRTFYLITRMFHASLALIIMLVLLQSLSGTFVFAIYGSIIFENSGFSNYYSLIYATILSCVRLAVTIIAILRIDSYSWGRRQLLNRGIVVMCIGYIGLVLTFAFHHQITARYFYLATTMIIVGGYSLSLGVVTRILQSEMFPTIIRSRTMAITTFVQNGIQFAILLLFLRASDAATYGSVFVVFLIFSVITLIFSFYLIPETIGRNPEQILTHVKDRMHKYLSCGREKASRRSTLNDHLVQESSEHNDEDFNLAGANSSFVIPAVHDAYVPPINQNQSNSRANFFLTRPPLGVNHAQPQSPYGRQSDEEIIS